MYKLVTLAIAAGALLGLCSRSVPALAQSAEEEVAKQTARQISDAISKRVGEDVGVIYAAPGAQGMAAMASAVGPMKTMPAFFNAAAKTRFSDRKP